MSSIVASASAACFAVELERGSVGTANGTRTSGSHRRHNHPQSTSIRGHSTLLSSPSLWRKCFRKKGSSSPEVAVSDHRQTRPLPLPVSTEHLTATSQLHKTRSPSTVTPHQPCWRVHLHAPVSPVPALITRPNTADSRLRTPSPSAVIASGCPIEHAVHTYAYLTHPKYLPRPRRSNHEDARPGRFFSGAPASLLLFLCKILVSSATAKKPSKVLACASVSLAKHDDGTVGPVQPPPRLGRAETSASMSTGLAGWW